MNKMIELKVMIHVIAQDLICPKYKIQTTFFSKV